MEQLYTILQFSKLTGIKNANLRFYDEIGLLSPIHRAENNYRLYSFSQLNQAWMIDSMRSMDVPLKDIKANLGDRTLNHTKNLLQHQIEHIDKEMERLYWLKKTLNEYINGIDISQNISPPVIRLEEHKATKLYLSPKYRREEDEIEMMVNFIHQCKKEKIAFSNNVGKLFNKESFIENGLTYIDHYYYFNENGNYETEPGLYLVSYDYYKSYKSGEQCKRIKDYIEEHPLTISGNIYMHTMLDEIVVNDTNKYLNRVMVKVSNK